MKILIYAQNFYPNVGGIERSSFLIADYLAKKKVKVTIITKTPSGEKNNFSFTILRNPGKNELKQVVKDADIIYMNGYYGTLFFMSIFMNKKIVMTYRDLSMICPIGTKWRVNRPCNVVATPFVCIPCMQKSGVERKLMKLVRPIFKILISGLIRSNVCTSEFGYKRFFLFRKRMILNGVDTTFFTPSTTKNKLCDNRIIFCGRLIPEKGCHVLIEASEKLTNKNFHFSLFIVGDGPFYSELRKLVRKKGLESIVTFMGTIVGKDLVHLLQTSSIAVVPSLWEEPFGLTAIEAMSCGVPVIAANVGGLGGIVSEAGLVYEREDVEMLSYHLEMLLNDSEQRKMLGTKSRKIALKKYDSKRMAEEYYKLFLNLMG